MNRLSFLKTASLSLFGFPFFRKTDKTAKTFSLLEKEDRKYFIEDGKQTVCLFLSYHNLDKDITIDDLNPQIKGISDKLAINTRSYDTVLISTSNKKIKQIKFMDEGFYPVFAIKCLPDNTFDITSTNKYC